MTRFRNRLPRCLATLVLLTSACDSDDAPKSDDGTVNDQDDSKAEAEAPTGAAQAGADAADTAADGDGSDSASQPPLTRVMRYLDPEARAVLMLTHLERFDFDPVTLGTVAGLPPGATGLLEAAHRANEYLDPADKGHPAWLVSEMMVVTPGSGGKEYIIARRSGDEASMEAALRELGLMAAPDSDPKTWYSTKRFPFKVTALDGDVIALIDGDELGSGMGPISAGRDMPPSEMRTQLGDMLGQDSAIELALHAGGPMLHLDTTREIVATQLGIRRGGADSMRVQTVLQPIADVDGVAKELNERKHPEETQAVQELMAKMKFVVDKDVIVGELSLDGDAVKTLE